MLETVSESYFAPSLFRPFLSSSRLIPMNTGRIASFPAAEQRWFATCEVAVPYCPARCLPHYFRCKVELVIGLRVISTMPRRNMSVTMTRAASHR